MTHYYLAPSSAALSVKCAAAPFLAKEFAAEEAEHPVTREGVAMHWAGAEILNGRPVALNQVAPNGVTLDWELMQATSVYTDDVFETVQKHPGALHVEETIHNDALHATLNGGTPDAWLLHQMAENRLYIVLWDFKGGHGIHEVFEHWQLINYAALILKALGPDVLDSNVMFCFRIVQPRAYHPEGPVRSWHVNGADLRAQFNILRAAYEKISPDGKEPLVCPTATPGAHCLRQHCAAAGRWCSALEHQSWDLIDFAYTSRPVTKNAHTLGLTLRTMTSALAMLQAQVDGMKEQALALERKGERVTFWTTVQGQGREIIPKDKVAEVVIIGDSLGIDVRKPQECLTPLQMRDAGMPPDIVAAYAFRKTGERKLVPDDGTEARKVFG